MRRFADIPHAFFCHYEDIYLRNYATVIELEQGLDQYFRFYNNERFHQSLGYRTPVQVYYDCQRTTDSNGQ
ncbi:MAG: integrase core domain-containing protein [Dehalococcoidia bacterium]|nr:integrase core domain-containing protein [Dehalococcoidia bacterium]